LTLGGWIIERS